MEATGLVAQDRQKQKWREFFENRKMAACKWTTNGD